MMGACSGAWAQAEYSQTAPIPAHTAVYEVLRLGNKVGEVHVKLSQAEDGVWLYETETRATARMARVMGLGAAESAYFMWYQDPQRSEHALVLMLSYYQLAQGPMRNRFWRHHVDWDRRISRTETREGQFVIDLTPGVIDPLTMRLQLAALLQNEQNRRTDQQFKVLERTSVEDQQFLFRGQGPVRLPMGCLDSLHFHRFRRPGSARNYDSWHSADFHWMPVRMVQNRDGEPYLDIRLIETSIALSPQPCR